MMERTIVLQFRNGSRRDSRVEFPVEGSIGIRLGRESTCDVCFGENDELVSRAHCRIDVEGSHPFAFKLSDLNSRNGTFVNRQRILGSVVLRSGDLLQLGPGGPEVQFTAHDGSTPLETVPSPQILSPEPRPDAKATGPKMLAAGVALLLIAAAAIAAYGVSAHRAL